MLLQARASSQWYTICSWRPLIPTLHISQDDSADVGDSPSAEKRLSIPISVSPKRKTFGGKAMLEAKTNFGSVLRTQGTVMVRYAFFVLLVCPRLTSDKFSFYIFFLPLPYPSPVNALICFVPVVGEFDVRKSLCPAPVSTKACSRPPARSSCTLLAW